MCVNCSQLGLAAADTLGLEPQVTKTISIAAAAILFLSLGTSVMTPATSVKAGATCAKSNQKVVKSGKTFVCKKSGGKLVWKLQVRKTKTQANTQNPGSVPTAPTEPAKPLLLWQRLGKDVYEKYDSIKSAPKANFDFILSPTVNRAKAQETIDAYSAAMKFWTPLQEMKKPLRWVLMSEKDYDWWLKTVKEIEGANASTTVWNPTTNVLGHCRLGTGAFCGYGNNYSNGDSFQYNVIGSGFNGKPSPHVVHHEAVHFYQFQVGLSYQKFPWWLIEGQANFFGWNIAERDRVQPHRDREKQRLMTAVPSAKTNSATDWARLIKRCTDGDGFCIEKELGYSLGWFAMEHLMTKINIEQMHELTRDVARSMSWQLAVPAHLKITSEQLDLQIGEYLVEVFKSE